MYSCHSMTTGNVVSAGYECNVSLVLPHRYNSMGTEVVFYQFFCEMTEHCCLTHCCESDRMEQGRFQKQQDTIT